jgi:predicted kinase
MLIAFSGLPGAGKTTIARSLAKRLGATYLRIDTIEDELLSMDGASLVDRGAGYCVAYALAEENLMLGRSVVADCVNPISLTRDAWRKVALRAGVRIVEARVVCSDVRKHELRISSRPAGTRGSSWTEVRARLIEAADHYAVVLDTSDQSVEQCVAILENALVREPIDR